MSRMFSRAVIAVASVASLGAALACEQQPAQGPQELTYENGYAQPTRGAKGSPQTTYQNGYAQQGGPAPATTATAAAPVTYTPTTVEPTTPAPTSTIQLQTTPVPLGVQPLPPPTATATAGALGATTAPPSLASPSLASKVMATPGPGAFVCQSDAQCLLGRCNAPYGHCAFPCKNSENDCKTGNVCNGSTGLCMPRGAGGVKM